MKTRILNMRALFIPNYPLNILISVTIVCIKNFDIFNIFFYHLFQVSNIMTGCASRPECILLLILYIYLWTGLARSQIRSNHTVQNKGKLALPQYTGSSVLTLFSGSLFLSLFCCLQSPLKIFLVVCWFT